uniref:Uncharacterized protein n=1 Tax=Odontella aurita TaxID=265563 RepID=A0A7S4IJV2_9STRA
MKQSARKIALCITLLLFPVIGSGAFSLSRSECSSVLPKTTVAKRSWTRNSHSLICPPDFGLYALSNSEEESLPLSLRTRTESFVLDKNGASVRRRRWRSNLTGRKASEKKQRGDIRYKGLMFEYNSDEIILGSDASKGEDTIGVMLIHPIGVGISRWYFHRLLLALESYFSDRSTSRSGGSSSGQQYRYVFIAPDLVGSGTCSNPHPVYSRKPDSESVVKEEELNELPLFNISDWSDQVLNLMGKYERGEVCESDQHLGMRPSVQKWCIVANGGCSPIALQVAARRKEELRSGKLANSPVTNVVLSAPPRLPFFLESADPAKVRKSFKTLCGISGKAFWWYALRNKGSFIQKFSEKNLVARPENLGERWTHNCLEAALMHGGRTRYSTFGFLAGALQDGCGASLNELKGDPFSDVQIDLIRGGDKQPNRAKSWFWKKKRQNNKKKERGKDSSSDDHPSPSESRQLAFRNFLQENGNGGKERTIGGRISLAHEDAEGYAAALIDLIGDI